MARLKKPKEITVQKFGGTEKVGDVNAEAAFDDQVKDVNYEVQSLEAKSQTKLEDDDGGGNAAIIRCFTFGMNLQTLLEVKPTKQEIFNSHLKGIEVALWRDGMKIMEEVPPRITFDAENMRYQIFVSARPMRGHILHERPQTLKEIVHGN